MPDTRRTFEVGTRPAGFGVGQELMTQFPLPAARRIGTYTWRPHATIHELTTVAGRRRVTGFHVSLYEDGGTTNWGFFRWTFDATNDRFTFQGFRREGVTFNTARDALDVAANRATTWNSLLTRVNEIARSLSGAFFLPATPARPATDTIAAAVWVALA